MALSAITSNMKTGFQSGNGVVTITYTLPSPCPAPVITGSTAVVTCSYNGTTGADGTDQTWTVPTGVTQATFDVFGAQGGGLSGFDPGGKGGETKATIPVVPSTTFSIVVAGQGHGFCVGFGDGAGGFGGGGSGGAGCNGAGGGGASSVSEGGSPALLVAGGGGGAANSTAANGGSGGGPTGDPGQSEGDPTGVGAPGTQSGGGVATGDATSGEAGQGGTGGTDGCSNPGTTGGGGGGGYYGGAGGGGCAGGGGGSGYADPSLTATSNTGVRSGNGVVTITYTLPATTSATTASVTGTGSTVVGGGGTLTDTLTVTGTSGTTPTNTTGGVDFYVCQVSTSSTLAPGVCPATGTAFDASEILSGTATPEMATATSNPFTPTGAGTWCFSATYGGDTLNAPSADNTTVTDDNECVLIGPASPSISTTPSATSITLGPTTPTLKDTAVLSGGYSPMGSITFTLHKPGGTVVDTETVSVNGDGSYTTANGYLLPTTGTVTGTYQWDASYASTDANNTTASENNAPGEQVVVSSASPTISTTPSATTITLGPTPPTLKDTAVLSGGYSPMGSITFTLHNPGGTVVDTETVLVNGNGSYTTANGYLLPITGTVTGTYQWDASYTGDANNHTTSENNATGEQVKVVSPCGSLTAYFLTATYGAGSFNGVFCVNAAGTGTYSQNGGATVTGKVLTSGGATWISASGTGLALLGEKTTTSSTFTETAPAPMKSGTFTLATLP